MLRKFLAGFVSCLLLLGYIAGADAVLKSTGGVSGVNSAGTVTSSQLLLQDGSANAPALAFTNDSNTGLYSTGSDALRIAFGGVQGILLQAGGFSLLSDSAHIDLGASSDTVLVRDAANTLAQKNSTNAQLFRLYFSTTGPVYWQATGRTNGVLYTGSGGSAQVSYAQTTVPTCSSNCGTSPSVAGTDTAGIVTMGATGVPASAWVVTFNGTWPAAPSCVVQSALASMVVGKMPIAVVTSTTTMTVTTNGTAPAAADKYQYHCLGVS